MDELNKALNKVISEYKEKGFELEVWGEKTINSRLPNNWHILLWGFSGKRSLQTGSEKVLLYLEEMKFDDDFLLMDCTLSKLKYFTTFRKYGKSYFGLLRGGLILFKVGLIWVIWPFPLMVLRLWGIGLLGRMFYIRGVSSVMLPIEGSRLGMVGFQQHWGVLL